MNKSDGAQEKLLLRGDPTGDEPVNGRIDVGGGAYTVSPLIKKAVQIIVQEDDPKALEKYETLLLNALRITKERAESIGKKKPKK